LDFVQVNVVDDLLKLTAKRHGRGGTGVQEQLSLPISWASWVLETLPKMDYRNHTQTAEREGFAVELSRIGEDYDISFLLSTRPVDRRPQVIEVREHLVPTLLALLAPHAR